MIREAENDHAVYIDNHDDIQEWLFEPTDVFQYIKSPPYKNVVIRKSPDGSALLELYKDVVGVKLGVAVEYRVNRTTFDEAATILDRVVDMVAGFEPYRKHLKLLTDQFETVPWDTIVREDNIICWWWVQSAGMTRRNAKERFDPWAPQPPTVMGDHHVKPEPQPLPAKVAVFSDPFQVIEDTRQYVSRAANELPGQSAREFLLFELTKILKPDG